MGCEVFGPVYDQLEFLSKNRIVTAIEPLLGPGDCFVCESIEKMSLCRIQKGPLVVSQYECSPGKPEKQVDALRRMGPISNHIPEKEELTWFTLAPHGEDRFECPEVAVNI
jgi:hypothetical protein